MAPRINIPSITRSLLISLVVLSLLNAAARYRSWEVDKTTGIGSRQYYAPYLTIVPGMSIQYPWVFVTATLAEQNPAGLIVTGATLFWGGKYLERAWGSTEYTKFIALVSLVPNLLTFLAYVSLYVVTRNPSLAYAAISLCTAIAANDYLALRASPVALPSKPAFSSPSNNWFPNIPFPSYVASSASASSTSRLFFSSRTRYQDSR